MMMLICLAGCLATLLQPLPAHAASTATCRVVQTMNRQDVPRDLAVSPSGNQLAVLTDYGLYVYALGSTGDIRKSPLVSAVGLKDAYRLAFTPNGQSIYIITNGGLLWRYDRTAGRLGGYLNLGISGQLPRRMCTLEDPSLLLLKHQALSEVLIVNWNDPSAPVDKLQFDDPGYCMGGSLAARADAGMVFWTMESSTYRGRYVMMAKPYRGSMTSWNCEIPYTPGALAIGPDPDHLLVAGWRTSQDGDLRIYRHDHEAGWVNGCVLSGFAPGDLAFSNDGYYAVMVDGNRCLLKAVSGHDLRAVLDPTNPLRFELVRQSQVSLGTCRAERVVMHPTRPVAYVLSGLSKRIQRVKIAIPGIEHPLAD
ncbi:MAG: hypothetical protein KKI08_24790 [Armatimonadetes bacterium]|nr:hypothetical protein [Armatimonadota bacterium]